MKHILNRTFEKIYFINLSSRKDRLQHALKQLNTEEGLIEAERFNAFNCRPYDHKWMTKAEQSCLLSHYTVIKMAQQNHLNNVLILEDDFTLCEDFSYNFYTFIREMPLIWDMLYLSGNHHVPHPFNGKMASKISSHVLKINYTLTTGAYAVNKSMYDTILEDLIPPRYQVDVHYAFLHSKIKAYASYPSLITQYASYSDIQKTFVDYTNKEII